MLQWDFSFSFGHLPLHHKQYKTKIFTSSITHLNSTQLLFGTWLYWISLFCYSHATVLHTLFTVFCIFSHFLCLFTCPIHSCTYSCSANFHFCMLYSLFPFPYTFLQPYSLFSFSPLFSSLFIAVI